MTYAADEFSTQDSQPVELYTIVTPTTTYRLTSWIANITVSGQVYAAAPISRDNQTTTPVGQTRELTVYVSIDHALSQDLLVGGIPQRDVSLTIVRYQQRSATTRQIWSGKITGIGTDGIQCKLRVPGKTDDSFAVKLPLAVAQRICNHALYDQNCKADRNAGSNNIFTTVTALSADGLTIGLASIGGHVDGWASLGDLARNIDLERRSVLTQVGTTLVIDVPFRTLAIGDQVRLYAGCDHQATTCRDKFVDPSSGAPNIVNFGGHPQLPTINPQSPTGFGTMVQG